MYILMYMHVVENLNIMYKGDCIYIYICSFVKDYL